MASKAVLRKIVRIDAEKCNGCGLCVPSCAEGAIRIVDGKAVLAAENLCDGLGNCLGECPQGAIAIEERPAEGFDESAVQRHLSSASRVDGGVPCPYPSAGKGMADSHAHPRQPRMGMAPHGPSVGMAPEMAAAAGHAGCPGAMARLFRRPGAPNAAVVGAPAAAQAASSTPSQLSQWPVQLALVPASGEFWRDADVLIAADCVPFALPEFHAKLLSGRKLAIACPKLDDMTPYVEKLAAIFSQNSIRSVTVAHMEVPCCGGIVYAVREAMDRAGRNDLPFRDVTVSIEGQVLETVGS
jgi:NAD-dependent dihydropyrimidine dehydrogenase PreA subunit